MTVKEVAVRFGVHPDTVRNWLRDGKINAERDPKDRRQFMIPETEIPKIIEFKQAKATRAVELAYFVFRADCLKKQIRDMELELDRVEEIINSFYGVGGTWGFDGEQ